MSHDLPVIAPSVEMSIATTHTEARYHAQELCREILRDVLKHGGTFVCSNDGERLYLVQRRDAVLRAADQT